MIVNVCPAAVTSALPDRVWSVLTTPERLGEWADAEFVRAEPTGPMRAGQKIWLEAPEFGRRWPVTIDVGELDPGRRWIDLRVRLPFGVVNHEHITLAETEAGGTLVRFN
jgi:ligand-binding SRPBCC domain-containing protein